VLQYLNVRNPGVREGIKFIENTVRNPWSRRKSARNPGGSKRNTLEIQGGSMKNMQVEGGG
jgi:hypothetical protein